MTVLGIVAVAIQLGLALVNYLIGKNQLDAETAQQLAGNLQGALDAITKAQKARQAVRDVVAVNPDSVRQPAGDDRPYSDGDAG